MNHLKRYNEDISQNVTKVLLVTTDDDFGALAFEQKYGDERASEVIRNVEEGSPNYQSPDGEWNLEVFTFEGKIDPKFARFIKTRIQDYDDSKNTNFYLESDIIGRYDANSVSER